MLNPDTLPRSCRHPCQQGRPLTTCSPHLARQAARASPHILPSLSRTQQLAPLLLYCLSDLDLSRPEGAQQLLGLRLLPCMDGSLTAFSGVGAAQMAGRQQQQQQQGQQQQGQQGQRQQQQHDARLVHLVSDDLEWALVKSQGEHWHLNAAHLYVWHYSALPFCHTRHSSALVRVAHHQQDGCCCCLCTTIISHHMPSFRP